MSDAPPPPPPPEPPAKSGMSNQVIGGLFCAGLFLVVIIIGAVAGGGEEGPTEEGAIDVCQQSVEDQLRSPGTAEFGDENARSTGDKTYVVTGWVDSENGFGALVRSEWTCNAVHVEGTEWRTNAELTQL